MSDINIPPEAVEAAAMALYDALYIDPAWMDASEDTREIYRKDARASIAAALAAWPWKFTADSIKMEHIVLPFPQENKNG